MTKSTHWFTRSLLVGLTLGALGSFARAQAPAGTIYIESNLGSTEGMNSVVAFTRDGSGVLTKLGEYPTKGTGVHTNFTIPIPDGPTLNTGLGPFDSDQNLLLSPDGKRLFAVNCGSDTIAVFNVNADGSLVAVKGSPFKSFGKMPVSIGFAGPTKNILAVVNKDYDLGRANFDVTKRAPNYTSFKIDAKGRLVRIPKSSIIAEEGGNKGLGYSNPTQALISPDGKLMFDVDFFGYQIHSFAVLPNGRLQRDETQFTPVDEQGTFPPFAGLRALPVPLGMAVHPTQPIVYVGFVFDSRIGVYYYNAHGEMQFLRSVPVGAGPCWVRVNTAGTRLYTSNTLSNSVSQLDLTDPYNPVSLAADFTLTAAPADAMTRTGASPFGINLDPGGQYLHAITIKALQAQSDHANALHVLKLDANGKITAETHREQFDDQPNAPQGITSR